MQQILHLQSVGFSTRFYKKWLTARKLHNLHYKKTKIPYLIAIDVTLQFCQNPKSVTFVLTFDILFQNIIDDRVNIVVNVLKQHRHSIHNSHFELLQKICVRESQNLQIISRFPLHDPSERLLLRINAQRKTRRSCRKDSILYG